MIPLAQMIEELDRGSILIINDEDREYVQGVKMLLDMNEVVGQEAILRIQQIYKEFVKLQPFPM